MGERKIFKSGEVIIRENTWEMAMYEIISGSVEVMVNYGTEKAQKISTLTAGETFGEMGLIEARMRSATVVALEDTEVEIIDAEGLGEYFKDSPEKIMEILLQMSTRLRAISDKYGETCRTISEYVDLQKSKGSKPGLFARIAAILEQAAKYDQELIQMGLTNFSDNFRHGGYPM